MRPADDLPIVALIGPLHAFGSTCAVWADTPDGNGAALAALVSSWWQTWERSWTRFDPRSDLNRVNDNAGQATAVPGHLLDAVTRAVRLRERTGSLFDPTVRVDAWGYSSGGRISRPLRPAWQPAEVTVGDGTVTVERGGRIDLGGIGKGLVADATAAGLAELGVTRAVIDIGGDLAVLGAWNVDAVDDDRRPWCRWQMSAGGLATSSSRSRRWQHHGREAHHLIDPRTHAPADSPYTHVAAHAADAATAEVAAKTALIAGNVDAVPGLDVVCAGLLGDRHAVIGAGAARWASPVLVLNGTATAGGKVPA